MFSSKHKLDAREDFSPGNTQQISPRGISDLCLHLIFLVWIPRTRKAKLTDSCGPGRIPSITELLKLC
jgi:hypothetical protein